MLRDPGSRMTSWLEAAWLQRYLERRLDAEETAWFEAYAMDKPELIDRIEADSDLRDGLAGASRGMADAVGGGAPAARAATAAGTEAETGIDSRTAPASTVASIGASTLARSPHGLAQDIPPRRRGFVNTLALAASLSAGVGIGWISQRSIAPTDLPVLMASPTRIIYDAVREERTPPRIEHADSKSPYVLIEVAVPPGAEHVTLKIGNARRELVPSPEGFVSFLVNREFSWAERTGVLQYESHGELRTHALDWNSTKRGSL